jgi:hypothetical protein
MTSPFGPDTVQTYRRLAALGLGGTLLLGFGATSDLGGHGLSRHPFKAGVSVGMTVLAALLSGGCLLLARYVTPRLNAPIEYWRSQQQRFRPKVFRAIYAGAGASVLLVAAMLATDMRFVAGIIFVPACFLGIVLGGKVTRQFGDY